MRLLRMDIVLLAISAALLGCRESPTAVPSVALARQVQEREPNDAPETATIATIADTLTGIIDHLYDRDFFAIDVTGGTRLQVDRRASNVRVEVFVTDNRGTLVGKLLDNEGSVVEIPLVKTGRYYLQMSVWDHDDPTATDRVTSFAYNIHLTPQP